MIEQKIDYSRHYKKWHSDTPDHIRGMKDFYRGMLFQFLPQNKDIQILDVGCGTGLALLSLQEQGYLNSQGIDVDEGQIQSCLNKQLKVTQTNDSIEYLSDKANTYDLIISLDVIEHIPHQFQLHFVKAINKALKSGGKLICTVPNANSVLASRWRYIDWTHHTSFTEHSLDFLLFNAGFDEIQIHPTEFFKPPKLSSLFSRSILSKQLWKTILHWQIFRLFRTFRKMEIIAELGWEEGRCIPLSLNLLATAVKP